MLFESMEDLYKNALRKLREPKNTDFKGFNVDWSYASFEKASEQTFPQIEQLNLEKIESPVETEKQTVLESFTQFTKEKLQDTSVYNFQGGQLAESLNTTHEGVVAENLDDFLKRHSNLFSEEYTQKRFELKSLSSQNAIKVCFVSDSFIEHPEQVDSPELAELNCFFDQEVALLFNKMIVAMGLKPNEYFVSALYKQMDESTSLLDNLIQEILYLKPQYIVSLGAKAVNELMGTHKRLKSIHGQFFALNFQDQNATIFEASLMPLFSPKLLHIAPNMKQTAWKDMQKLMEKLAKFVK